MTPKRARIARNVKESFSFRPKLMAVVVEAKGLTINDGVEDGVAFVDVARTAHILLREQVIA